MAKITIEELCRGEKYDIMSAVTAKALQLGIDERTEEGRTWIEMELVRQNFIRSKQRKGRQSDLPPYYLQNCIEIIQKL